MPNEPELRHAVLEYLYPRRLLAQDAATIAARLRRAHGCTAEDVRQALEYLKGLNPPLVQTVTDPLNRGTLYWQIATAGIQHLEGEFPE
jgi:hypothetical protein